MSDPASPLTWTEDGQPRSRLYGDIYFSTADGLSESRAVFLRGCDLPDAWAGRRRFVVGELGFGSGLNILALLHLWREARPSGGRLHVFTVEAHPITADEARAALAPWPEIAELTALLTSRWPGVARGVHRIDLPELDAVIDVAIGEVGEALAGWSGSADAWFLDGFSPALNPAMWRDEVLGLVGARSAPGARAATFTVAGQVRRGLAEAGFTVDKRPGHGRKRERLEATYPGVAADPPTRRVAIIGAGIAGAAAARAVRALGGEPIVLEAAAPGAGGSGNPAALVTPRLDAGLGAPAQLFARAFARAVQLYEAVPDAVLARGVLQMEASPRDAQRFAAIARSDLFEPGALRPEPEGLVQTTALTVDPGPILSAWLGQTGAARVRALRADGEGWLLLDPAGDVLDRADAVIIAAGLDSAALASGVILEAVRGQATWATVDEPMSAVAWGGYAAPTRSGVLFGATHDRGDLDCEVREADHRRNLETLDERLPDLASRLAGLPLEGRASIRATTRDRLPLAGRAPGAPGVFLLTGFGSRGFSLAPLLAEHVAALALGAPSPLPASLAVVTNPGRFRERALRKGVPEAPPEA